MSKTFTSPYILFASPVVLSTVVILGNEDDDVQDIWTTVQRLKMFLSRKGLPVVRTFCLQAQRG